MQAALHGVLPVHQGQFDTLQQNGMRWSNRLKQAMAVCNGLSWINKTVVGLDMERSMFKAVEARFLVPFPCPASSLTPCCAQALDRHLDVDSPCTDTMLCTATGQTPCYAQSLDRGHAVHRL